MKVEGIRPDFVTFLSILNACSHIGLVEMGHYYLNAAVEAYGISPTLQHHTCMIDLLSRTGHLDKAVDMLKKMQYQTDFVLWNATLDACRKLGHLELAKMAFEQIIQFNNQNTTLLKICFKHEINASNETY